MPWLRQSDHTHTNDDVLYGKDFEYFQLLLKNDSKFMNLENDALSMTAEEKMAYRKARLLQIARKEMMDSVRCAMETLEEYAEDLIRITAPKEKVIDGEVKTYNGWEDSGKNFSDYVKEGDKVDEEMVMYFAEVVPPRTYNKGMIQCGEPYDSAKEGMRYDTFIYLYNDKNYGGEVWMYKGHCLAGSTDKGTEIQRL